MYQLKWADFDQYESGHGSVIGSRNSIFEVWFHFVKNFKWDVLELWYLGDGTPTYLVDMDGYNVLWWNETCKQALKERGQ